MHCKRSPWWTLLIRIRKKNYHNSLSSENVSMFDFFFLVRIQKAGANILITYSVAVTSSCFNPNKSQLNTFLPLPTKHSVQRSDKSLHEICKKYCCLTQSIELAFFEIIQRAYEGTCGEKKIYLKNLHSITIHFFKFLEHYLCQNQ